MSIMILLIALALWGIVHSILASNFAKDMLGGASIYRLGYNLFAALSFVPILYLMKILPDQFVYQVPAPWNILMLGGQIFAAIMLFVAFLQTDSLSFVGLRQLFETGKSSQLVTRGLYRIVRHPLYTFGLLFIWLTSTVTQNSLTVYIGATIYTLVGAYFEERKLLREFGDAYAEYRRATPMLIPSLMTGKK
jgi:protein-S-isoprenylcysteine O-methyltransferase Ste14